MSRWMSRWRCPPDAKIGGFSVYCGRDRVFESLVDGLHGFVGYRGPDGMFYHPGEVARIHSYLKKNPEASIEEAFR